MMAGLFSKVTNLHDDREGSRREDMRKEMQREANGEHETEHERSWEKAEHKYIYWRWQKKMGKEVQREIIEEKRRK